MDTPPRATLDGWTVRSVTVDGITHDCHEKGTGPGVVLLPELPGMTPEVLGLGEHLVGEGFTVVVPSLFGVPDKAQSPGYLATSLARACVSKEFGAFATRSSRPVSAFLRSVARELDARTPGRGVGVIGMCFSGGFALAAAVDESVTAPVLSQPSVPLPLGRRRSADVGLSDGELSAVIDRTRNGLCVLGLRFSEDRLAPASRFTALRDLLGDAFEVIELDSSRGNAAGFTRAAHSVLTLEVREETGHPALVARTRMVEFLRERLG